MKSGPVLFFLKVYLFSALACALVNAGLGEIPSVAWVVLFPMITLLVVLLVDYWDKNVQIIVRVH